MREGRSQSGPEESREDKRRMEKWNPGLYPRITLRSHCPPSLPPSALLLSLRGERPLCWSPASLAGNLLRHMVLTQARDGAVERWQCASVDGNVSVPILHPWQTGRWRGIPTHSVSEGHHVLPFFPAHLLTRSSSMLCPRSHGGIIYTAYDQRHWEWKFVL